MPDFQPEVGLFFFTTPVECLSDARSVGQVVIGCVLGRGKTKIVNRFVDVSSSGTKIGHEKTTKVNRIPSPFSRFRWID